jgi:hypothetical protein
MHHAPTESMRGQDLGSPAMPNAHLSHCELKLNLKKSMENHANTRKALRGAIQR